MKKVNLVELNAQEVNSVEGGVLPVAVAVSWLWSGMKVGIGLGAAAAGVYND